MNNNNERKTRYLKLRGLALFYVWEDARILAYWNHSLGMHISYLGPVSCVSTSWVLLGLTVSREGLTEKAMAPHSNTLAWKIPWREESGRLQSMGSQRVRHDWATSRHFTSSDPSLGFSSGSAVKNLPAMQEMQETRVQSSLGGEDPLEEGVATHSSIFAWRIPRTEEPGWLQSIGSKESDSTETT